MHGKLTEWNTNQGPFPLAGSLLLPIQCVTKPVVLASGAGLSSPKESPSSSNPPGEISSSRLTKLTRGTTDRKSEFLKPLKDDRNGDFSESRDCDKLEDLEDHSTPEPKENGEEAVFRMVSLSPHCGRKGEHELKELYVKAEQLRSSNGFGKKGFWQSRSVSLFSPWRRTGKAELEESDTEASRRETSDGDAWK
ncbi:Vasculin-like protein 1 [Heterocephalus glaber]|uniref:Vasculin-like protein 1 n=1 Tax=Heterocephalus glaber TaxID=10181 RepID=G5BI66_HETGA|nr:Vasculin-like protein 1 [Heterocephalus glaber]